MLEFLILVAVIHLLSKISLEERAEDKQPKAWDFENVDDVMEFRELRRSGWRGNAEDFYKLRKEGQL